MTHDSLTDDSVTDFFAHGAHRAGGGAGRCP